VKKIKIIITFFLVLLLGTSCSTTEKKEQQQDKKPIVAVTTFALYDITKHIAQESVELINILPFGVDPHSFEPTPKLMAKIEKADVVFYSGAGLEPWIHGFHFTCKAIDMSKYVTLRELNKDEFEHHQHHDEQCAHNTLDPHYWLDFENMKKMTEVITQELIRLQPMKKEVYLAHKKSYISMLDNLEKEYKEILSQCRLDSVVISHNALGYLSQKYNFKVESLSGLSPEAQPSAKDITRVMQDIKKEHISTVFFEHFVNDAIVKSIAKDTGVTLEVFQPLGNITADEAKAGLSYEDIMKKNLNKLSKALMCK